MTEEEIKFVDKVREEWFQANSDKTPVTILKEIPSTIKKLISIIDDMQEREK